MMSNVVGVPVLVDTKSAIRKMKTIAFAVQNRFGKGCMEKACFPEQAIDNHVNLT
jgi:hypothetical protein